MNNIWEHTKNTRFYILIALFATLYLFASTLSFAGDITYSGDPINLIVNNSDDELKIILEFDGIDGDIDVTTGSATLFSVPMTEANGIFFSATGGQLTITVNNDLNMVNDILDGGDPILIFFDTNELSDGTNTNASPIAIVIICPQMGGYLSIDDYDTFQVSTYTRIPAPGSQIFVFFNKADFEKEYPEADKYYEYGILPQSILSGKLSPGGVNSIFTKSFNMGADVRVDIPEALVDTPYTGIYLTTSDPQGPLDSNDINSPIDYGTVLFDGSIGEGMRFDSTATDRPTVTVPHRFVSYYLSEADNEGYNAYVIVNFENDIDINLKDSGGNTHLPLGIDFRQNSADPFINFSEVGFDAAISGSKLILKFKDSRFSSSSMLFVTISKGTLKDSATGAANLEIPLFEYFNLDSSNNPIKFVHGQVDLASIMTSTDMTVADVELNLKDSGSVYNSYIAVEDFDLLSLEDGATLIASAPTGIDNTVTDGSKDILTPQTTNFITGVGTNPAMLTRLSGLTAGKDYYWITTAALDSAISVDNILEGHITKFTTLSPAAPMDMIGLTYELGSNDSIIGDDFAIATFSVDISNIGTPSDYQLWIDYDSDGTLDVELDDTDYSISQATPREIRFDWLDSVDDYLDNKYNARLKVKVKKLTALEPEVSSSAYYLYADIAGRNVDLLSAAISIPNTSIMIPIENFDSAVKNYTDLLILPSIAYNGATTLQGVTKDSKATLSLSNINHLFTIMVTAEENRLTDTYTFQLVPDRFLLRDIQLNAVSVTSYHPHIFTYDIVLPKGTRELPEITTLWDDPLPTGVDVSVTSSGELSTGKVVIINTLDGESSNSVMHTYTLNFTVMAGDPEPETPDERPSPSDDDNKASSSDNDHSNDDDIINKAADSEGSLLDIPSSTGGDDASPSGDTQAVTSLIKRIKTSNGARIILEQMPKTLDELTTMKKALSTLDDALQLDKDIAALISETERLIGLLQQPQQSRTMLLQVINPLGAYYNTVDKHSPASKKLMNSTIQMANTAIAQAGTIQTSWKSVKIREGGRVALAPSENEILQAARRAAKAELELEKQLEGNFEQGLQNGVISSVTLNLPIDLSNAPKTAAELTPETFQTLRSNNIQRVILNLGPVSFEVDQRFIEAHQQAHLEFNVDRQSPLSPEDKEALPQGTRTIGAPILELSALQNHTPGNAFNRPLRLAFNLDAFELDTNGPIDYENELIIYRENPETGQWEAVGGTYDPITNSLSIRRMHLSKYTVLKTEKNYSNIEDSWAKNEIAALKGKGIIHKDELFAANDTVTREEFAGWISNAYGLNSNGLETDLKDLDPESPYYDAIATAYEQGLITGKSNATFDPDGEVSREEMAVMIAAAMTQYDYPVDTDTFELAQYEEDLPTWAVTSVEIVIENGAVDESFFGSADAVTKEEAANILYQVYR